MSGNMHGEVVFELCERTDKQKDVLITILHTPK